MSSEMWHTIRLALLVSPFWFLAKNIEDGDELLKTMTGLAMFFGVTLFQKKEKKTDATRSMRSK